MSGTKILSSEPEPTLKRLFAFVGEAWNASVVEEAFRKTEVKGLGDWKGYGASAIDAESIGRWRRLSRSTIAELAPIVAPVLERCGYPSVEAERPRAPDEAMRHYELAMMWKATRQRERAEHSLR